MRPARGLVLVKPVTTEESMGRIVLLKDTRKAMTAQQMIVVAVGAPERCKLKRCRRPHTQNQHVSSLTASQWILIKPRSLIDATDGLYLVRQSDVVAVFKSTDDAHIIPSV